MTSRRGSTLVAAGIFLSRVAGVVRQAAVNHFFGVGPIADAFTAAFRIPNLMQNLLGEGVLSASFIPVYARLLEEGRDEDAGRVAGSVLGLLAMAAGAFTLGAVVLAGPLTSLIAPGYAGATRDLTVDLVRIITPGVALLVLSAWCLGILNSHRRFFLSYVAPVVWNLVQVLVLVGAAVVLLDDPLRPSGADTDTLGTLVRALGVGTLVGGLAQFLIQLPTVVRLDPHLRPSIRRDLPGVRQVLDAFAPIVAGRGVVQLSAYLDLFLASLLAAGAVSGLMNAQLLYLLPISLFGMSVAAAELPELSRQGGAGPDTLDRLDRGLSTMAFYVVGSVVVFVVVGDLVVGALFSRGAFGRDDEVVVWVILAAFSFGLLATTSSRLLQSALYAAGDARTPARIAASRVVLSALVGVVLMLQFDRFAFDDGVVTRVGSLPAFTPVAAELRAADVLASDAPLRFGAVGLAVGAMAGSWYEFRRLASAAAVRFGARLPSGGTSRRRLILPAAAAVVAGLLARFLFGDWPRLLGGPLAVALVGVAYVLVALRTRVAEASTLLAAITRRVPLARVVALRRAQRRRRRDRRP